MFHISEDKIPHHHIVSERTTRHAIDQSGIHNSCARLVLSGLNYSQKSHHQTFIHHATCVRARSRNLRLWTQQEAIFARWRESDRRITSEMNFRRNDPPHSARLGGGGRRVSTLLAKFSPATFAAISPLDARSIIRPSALLHVPRSVELRLDLHMITLYTLFAIFDIEKCE